MFRGNNCVSSKNFIFYGTLHIPPPSNHMSYPTTRGASPASLQRDWGLLSTFHPTDSIISEDSNHQRGGEDENQQPDEVEQDEERRTERTTRSSSFSRSLSRSRTEEFNENFDSQAQSSTFSFFLLGSNPIPPPISTQQDDEEDQGDHDVRFDSEATPLLGNSFLNESSEPNGRKGPNASGWLQPPLPNEERIEQLNHEPRQHPQWRELKTL